jgi:hypothetical protein
MSTPELVPAQDVKNRVLDLSRKRFAPQAAATPGLPGVRVSVQYGLFLGGDGGKTLHFGARGFLQGPPGPRVVMLEADSTLDVPAPECAPEACAQAMLASVVEPGMGLLLDRLEALCRMETEGLPAVQAALAAQDAWVRGKAAQAVGEQGLDRLKDALRPLVEEQDPEVAAAAIAALGRLKAVDAIGLLVRRSQRAGEVITQAVAVALGDMDSPAADRYLKEWAASHPLESVRSLAAELLSD